MMLLSLASKYNYNRKHTKSYSEIEEASILAAAAES